MKGWSAFVFCIPSITTLQIHRPLNPWKITSTSSHIQTFNEFFNKHILNIYYFPSNPFVIKFFARISNCETKLHWNLFHQNCFQLIFKRISWFGGKNVNEFFLNAIDAAVKFHRTSEYFSSLRSKHASSHHVAFYWYVLGRNSFPRRLRSLSAKNSRNFPHLGKLSCGKKGFGKFRDSLFSCNVLKVSQENILKNVFHNQRIKVFTLKELNIFRPIWNFLLFWASTLIIRFHGFSYENFLKLFRNCQLKH